MKISLGAQNCLSPVAAVLVGANVGGRPNYLPMAWVGIVDYCSVSLAMAKAHHTHAGVRENRTFSVNLPSLDLIADVDYCGSVSGRQVDKAGLFESFYGELGTAPMIRQCPVNMECRLTRILDLFPAHDIFVGEIVATYCDEECITDGVVDLSKVRPILYAETDASYWTLGERFGEVGSAAGELRSPAP
jgi:flavin reductase (DIM6/NTAB) family NADH-FMN oxidoreductase RutF